MVHVSSYGCAASMKATRYVLFVCVENSFRSQIAEAYFNEFAPEGWAAVSAGIKPSENIHPNAVELMREEGVDISGKRPRHLTREIQEQSNLAVIVCSGSQCPVIYADRVLEWNIPDPADMPLDEARKIRDEIKRRVLDLIEKIKKEELEGVGRGYVFGG
ncbi:MAG: arsenate reductase ArsC [Aigarchaeota archaeon]|nr:arsenate reductase ArsC [Aigarchaeota archaeon]